jgi:hypothetical protein
LVLVVGNWAITVEFIAIVVEVHGCAELVADVKVDVPAVIIAHRQRAATSVVGRGWQPW